MARTATSAKKVTKRIQLDLNQGAYQELEKLRGELNAATMSEVIRSSLKITKLLSEEKSKKEIILRDKTTGREERLIL